MILSCDNLVKIILQFDIIVIQEVLDKTEKSLESLLEAEGMRWKTADPAREPTARPISPVRRLE